MALWHVLEDRGLSFTFVWCPGRIAIEGNEEADAADNLRVDAIAIRPDDAKLVATSTIINACHQTCKTWQSKHSAMNESVRE